MKAKKSLSHRDRMLLKRRRRVVVESQDDGDGNWLVSYADLMTLLFMFFVIISAFSTPDAKKLEQLKQATSESLGVAYEKPFQDLSESIEALLKKTELEEEIRVEDTTEGVSIISKGTTFFDSGSVALKPQAENLIENLVGVISTHAKGFRIVVEGHTDDAPISTVQFPSNWELSSARAGVVVRLLEQRGMSRNLLRPVGLADTDPILPNRNVDATPNFENMAENRRIVIRIQKML